MVLLAESFLCVSVVVFVSLVFHILYTGNFMVLSKWEKIDL